MSVATGAKVADKFPDCNRTARSLVGRTADVLCVKVGEK